MGKVDRVADGAVRVLVRTVGRIRVAVTSRRSRRADAGSRGTFSVSKHATEPTPSQADQDDRGWRQAQDVTGQGYTPPTSGVSQAKSAVLQEPPSSRDTKR